MATTTTTTTVKIVFLAKPKRIFLNDFLDLHSLTRAQRSYYLKHHTTVRVRERTIGEWQKRIKI